MGFPPDLHSPGAARSDARSPVNVDSVCVRRSTKPRREPRYFWWAGVALGAGQGGLAMLPTGDGRSRAPGGPHQVQDPGPQGARDGSPGITGFRVMLPPLRASQRYARGSAEDNVNGDEMSGSNLILVSSLDKGEQGCRALFNRSSKVREGHRPGSEITAGSAVRTQEWTGSRRTWVWGHRHCSGSPTSRRWRRRKYASSDMSGRLCCRHAGEQTPRHLRDQASNCDQACYPLTRDRSLSSLLRSLPGCLGSRGAPDLHLALSSPAIRRPDPAEPLQRKPRAQSVRNSCA